MAKYAIPITEANLDLIQVLNGGRRPLVEEEKTYFLFTVVPPHTTENPVIENEETFRTVDDDVIVLR
jgi:hypothetical protein